MDPFRVEQGFEVHRDGTAAGRQDVLEVHVARVQRVEDGGEFAAVAHEALGDVGDVLGLDVFDVSVAVAGERRGGDEPGAEGRVEFAGEADVGGLAGDVAGFVDQTCAGLEGEDADGAAVVVGVALGGAEGAQAVVRCEGEGVAEGLTVGGDPGAELDDGVDGGGQHHRGEVAQDGKTETSGGGERAAGGLVHEVPVALLGAVPLQESLFAGVVDGRDQRPGARLADADLDPAEQFDQRGAGVGEQTGEGAQRISVRGARRDGPDHALERVLLRPGQPVLDDPGPLGRGGGPLRLTGDHGEDVVVEGRERRDGLTDLGLVELRVEVDRRSHCCPSARDVKCPQRRGGMDA